MPTLTCPSCGLTRTVSRSMISQVKHGRATERCRPCFYATQRGRRGPLDERFWSKVDTTGDCWMWKAVLTKHGYGQINVDGRMVRAHRAAWMIEHGEIPVGLHVLHRCDNRACARPSHLFVGTHADNMGDMGAKGRQRGGRRGTATPRTTVRLTSEQAQELRDWARASGLSVQALLGSVVARALDDPAVRSINSVAVDRATA